MTPFEAYTDCIAQDTLRPNAIQHAIMQHLNAISTGLSTQRTWFKQRPHCPGAYLWGTIGSGKSTLANAVNSALFSKGLSAYVLDGDNFRHGLCKDLGFSDFDRQENIRRIGEVAKLFLDAGVIVLTAFVSPFRADRA